MFCNFSYSDRRAIRYLNNSVGPKSFMGIVFSFGDVVVLGPHVDNQILNHIDVYNRGVEIYGDEYFIDKLKNKQLEKTKKEESKIIKYSRFSIMEIE
jgi:hypothetical protein